MKHLFILFLLIILFTSCDKQSRIDHEDNKYIYAWNYEGNDSILVKYNKPIKAIFKEVFYPTHEYHFIKYK